MTKIWEQYARVSDHVQGHDRKLIQEALDKIVSANDNEGIELLSKAKTRNGGNLVLITALDMRTSVRVNDRSNPSGYFINMNLGEIANLTFEVNGAARHPSVMGLLVHELYHVADDRSYVVHATLAQLNLLRTGEGSSALVPEVLIKAAQEESRQVLEDIKNNRYFNDDDEVLFDPRKYPSLAEVSRLIYREIVMKGMDSEHYTEAERMGITRYGAPKREADATSYTDAFMKKNGCNEPWRGRYYNNNETRGRTAQDAANPICSGMAPTRGFVAESVMGYENLGQLEAPRIRSHEPEKSPPLRFQ